MLYNGVLLTPITHCSNGCLAELAYEHMHSHPSRQLCVHPGPIGATRATDPSKRVELGSLEYGRSMDTKDCGYGTAYLILCIGG